MKHNEIPHLSFPCHDAGLPSSQMIPVAGLFRIDIQIGGLTVKEVSTLGKYDDLGLILVVIAGVDDISQFLASREGQKLCFDVTQDELTFLSSMLIEQRGGKPKVIRLPLPDISFHVLQPTADRQPCVVQSLLVDINVELFLQ